jgi:hypothetical protein
MVFSVFIVSERLLLLGLVKLGGFVKGGGVSLELSLENVDLVDLVRGGVEFSTSSGSNGDHCDACVGWSMCVALGYRRRVALANISPWAYVNEMERRELEGGDSIPSLHLI